MTSEKNLWLQGLNPEQVEAVLHTEGPLLILAGAGSGKTTVLVSRTGRLIAEKKALPGQILVMTFTNKAARELKHRVAKKIGPAGQGLVAGTFHSFGLQILKTFHEEAELPKNFGLLDTTDCHSLLRELMRDVKISGKDRFDVDRLLQLINRRRTEESPRTQAIDEYDELAEVLEEKFTRRLQLLGAVDFEGLLLKPLDLFSSHPEILQKVQNRFRQIMVDEFQDTNHLQMKLIDRLSSSHLNLSVVGDDDQSIYGWRGAQIQNILSFPQKHANCRVIKLERNYRSVTPIVALANEVISKNRHRHGKVLRAEKGLLKGQLPEVFVFENEEEESEFVVSEIRRCQKEGRELKDIAVLYRSNTQGGLIESSLRRERISYSISGGQSLFDRKEIKDAFSYLRQALAPQEATLKRIINTPPRGIGDTTLERLNEFAKKENVSFLEACRRWKEAQVQEKAGLGLESLHRFLEDLPERLIRGPQGNTAGERFVQALREIGYRDFLLTTTADSGGAEKKWMLVEIFGRVLDSFLRSRSLEKSSLREFIDSMMLRDEIEDEEDQNRVQLMTLHASKGLEFPVVLLVGLEEDLLPHKNLGSDVDEERRLFYVGITRAQEHLILTRCQSRKRHGSLRPSSPSRFLVEISKELYTEFPLGVRPVSGAARDELVAQFLKSLEKSPT